MHNSIEKNKKIGDLNYFSITTEREKKNPIRVACFT